MSEEMSRKANRISRENQSPIEDNRFKQPKKTRSENETAAALAFLLLVGVGIGDYFLSGLTGFAFDTVLSFGAAALLYLVTEELLVEAHETPETPLTTAMFFVGFVLLLLVEMLA